MSELIQCCEPVSSRLHETLIDLIDWSEHQGVWAVLSSNRVAALEGQINLADTSQARFTPHRASNQCLGAFEGTIKSLIVFQNEYKTCGLAASVDFGV